LLLFATTVRWCYRGTAPIPSRRAGNCVARGTNGARPPGRPIDLSLA